VNPSDTIAISLFGLISLVITGGLFMTTVVRLLKKKQALREQAHRSVGNRPGTGALAHSPLQSRRPNSWLAIRCRDMAAVQGALGLHNARPCSWAQGLTDGRRLFIAPPLNGWTLAFGSGLPDPGEDVDAAFRFVRELSRKLGQVQFFQAEPLLQHHAWVLAESGRIVRAYAWAGATVWNQGIKTTAETALGVKCFGYGEVSTTDEWTVAAFIVANVEKVPQIARRWSLDPAEIDLRTLASAHGIAGQHSRRY